jgi:hypothetical protein
MRFYKFNRNRSVDPWRKYWVSQNKASYLADRGKLRVLDSFHTENQTWGALHKAWKGYTIAKNKFELARMEYYARVIQKLQNELGLQVSSFPDLSLYPAEGEVYSEYGEDITYDVDYVSNQDMKEW